jgi:hypothetical protein
LRRLASRHESLQLARLLDCRGEVFVARLGDENVVLDAVFKSEAVISAHWEEEISLPDTANVPVLGEHIGINVLAVFRVFQVGVDDELAKVDLQKCEI